ncbi:MAG: metal-sensing transcriptional repressor [Nevskiaceae bacterium]|nr:MAG: metal-sensing transcriptional repressor [Nevskiaceae bacterium]
MHHFPEILKRLKRAHGHLDSIIEMLEAGRPCMDVAQQLQAVEKAIDNAKKALIHEHLDHCLEDATRKLPAETRRLLKEFEAVTKYL